MPALISDDKDRFNNIENKLKFNAVGQIFINLLSLNDTFIYN